MSTFPNRKRLICVVEEHLQKRKDAYETAINSGNSSALDEYADPNIFGSGAYRANLVRSYLAEYGIEPDFGVGLYPMFKCNGKTFHTLTDALSF